MSVLLVACLLAPSAEPMVPLYKVALETECRYAPPASWEEMLGACESHLSTRDVIESGLRLDLELFCATASVATGEWDRAESYLQSQRLREKTALIATARLAALRLSRTDSNDLGEIAGILGDSRPDSPSARPDWHYALALLRWRQQDVAASRLHIQEVLTLDPTFPDANRIAAIISSTSGRPPGTNLGSEWTHLDRGLFLFPNPRASERDELILRGWGGFNGGGGEVAIAAATAALLVDCTGTEPRRQLATIMAGFGNVFTATHWARQIHPQSVRTSDEVNTLWLSALADYHTDPALAAEQATAMIKQFADPPELRYFRATCYVRLQRYSEAFEDFRSAQRSRSVAVQLCTAVSLLVLVNGLPPAALPRLADDPPLRMELSTTLLQLISEIRQQQPGAEDAKPDNRLLIQSVLGTAIAVAAYPGLGLSEVDQGLVATLRGAPVSENQRQLIEHLRESLSRRQRYRLREPDIPILFPPWPFEKQFVR